MYYCANNLSFLVNVCMRYFISHCPKSYSFKSNQQDMWYASIYIQTMNVSHEMTMAYRIENMYHRCPVTDRQPQDWSPADHRTQKVPSSCWSLPPDCSDSPRSPGLGAPSRTSARRRCCGRSLWRCGVARPRSALLLQESHLKKKTTEVVITLAIGYI